MRILKIFGILVLTLGAIFCSNTGFARTINVGVISDGHTSNSSTLLEMIDEETRKLLPEGDQINFAEKNIHDGNWNISAIRQKFEALLASPDADVILAIGPVASQIAAAHENLKKPVLAAHVINAAMQGLKKVAGTSGTPNLTYIDAGIDIGRHIDRFQEIRRFSTMHLLISSYMLEGIAGLPEYLRQQAEERDVKLVVIPVGSNLAEAVAKLADAEAVYVAPMLDMPPEQQKQLIGRINAMKVPSMAMIGRAPVESGVLCSIAMEIDTQKLARRIALNFQRLLMNDDPSTFQVDFSHTERLTINMQTAREIGVYPTWSQMTDAVLLNEEPDNVERKLSITQVIETALLRNLQLIAKKQELTAGEHTVDRAKSNLRPKISAFGRQTMLDQDRAESIMTPGQHATQIGADLMMVLYSEQARANIDIQKLFQSARREEERALMLDIIRDAAISYLNVLKTRTLQNIQRDNLEVTRANLEIAKFREQVGTSGPAEVYRWEIQMAGARQALIDATAMRRKAEMALNQVLAASQEEEFTTADCDIFSEVFFLDYEKVAPYIDNQMGYKLFRDFLVGDTFVFSPEIQQISRGIEAMDRSKKSAKNRYSHPTIALQSNFSRTVRESGVGAVKPAMPAPFNSVFNYPDKNDWHVALNISIPLYEGGDRKAAIKEAEANLKKLAAEKEYLMQRLELNTRASLEDARASFSSIDLAKTRAEYASKTLELVRNAYSRGAVNILDLIDAQNASLVSREASANAVFAFLSDFVRVCRAVGTFDFILNHESNSEWYDRLVAFYNANGSFKPMLRKAPAVSKIEPTVSEEVLYDGNETSEK